MFHITLGSLYFFKYLIIKKFCPSPWQKETSETLATGITKNFPTGRPEVGDGHLIF